MREIIQETQLIVFMVIIWVAVVFALLGYDVGRKEVEIKQFNEGISCK